MMGGEGGLCGIWGGLGALMRGYGGSDGEGGLGGGSAVLFGGY